jgi:hypothetical protein
VTLRFLDGTAARAAELRRIAPGLVFELATLPVGFATAAPDPSQRARDMVTADEHGACFAESVDLVTRDGQSLRLELDTENDNRFCRWRRETPVILKLCVALRARVGGEVQLFAVECEGVIADQPAGGKGLGWDRLFVPDGFTETLAVITERALTADDPDPVGLRTLVYGDLLASLTA